MKKLCCIFSIVFAVSTALLAYKFLISGKTVPASDGRSAILLTPGERDLVLAEMRSFLETVQVLTVAIEKNDVDMAVAATRKVGAAAQAEVPASLVGKLPISFKKLGFDTHSQFDRLALDTESFGHTSVVLPALSRLMQNCVGCHAAYRIDVEQL